MCRCYKVDIVTAQLLEMHHDRRQFTVGNHTAIGIFATTDGIVLAKAAKKVAATEKDGTRTTVTDQNTLFTKMRAVTCRLG